MKTNNEDCLTISIEQAAKKIGISRNLAYRLFREKKLPGVIELGPKRMVVSAAAIEKLLRGDSNLKEN